MIQQSSPEFNRLAIECQGHRMVMRSSGVLLKNPRHNDEDVPGNDNVVGHAYHYTCTGSCKQSYSQVTKKQP